MGTWQSPLASGAPPHRPGDPRAPAGDRSAVSARWHVAQRARGEYLGGKPPFGSSTTPSTGSSSSPISNASELCCIRKLSADGLSPYKISADLASPGVSLSHVTVRKIIAGRPNA
jgi:hypothetical protein